MLLYFSYFCLFDRFGACLNNIDQGCSGVGCGLLRQGKETIASQDLMGSFEEHMLCSPARISAM